ncbi:hypothetical protein BDW66DRAFT_169051 [Aspergillus desertorum]
MSFSIDAGGTNPFSISADKTPLVLDESTRALYNRAIFNPSSLTDQERRLITHRPPPDEEDTLCRNACALPMGELVAKAINSGNNNVKGQSGHILSEVARLSPEDRDFKARAMKAATTDDIRAAKEVAQRVLQRWLGVELAADKALNNDDLVCDEASARDSAPGSDSGPGGQGPGEASGCFGLVVFYPKEEEGGRRLEYKSLIETAVYHGLHYSPTLIKDETRDRFILHWGAVPGSNNSMDPSALRSRFSTVLSNNEIFTGFRGDAFLYVDDEAFRSRETTRPYLCSTNPDTDILVRPQPDSPHSTLGSRATSGVGINQSALIPAASTGMEDGRRFRPILFYCTWEWLA